MTIARIYSIKTYDIEVKIGIEQQLKNLKLTVKITAKRKGKKMINVDIDLGRHTMRIPHGMKKLFEEVLKSVLGISQGNFKVHLGRQIKGGTGKGIKFIKLLPVGSGMIVKAQPIGRDGRHICTLKFPDMYKDKLSEFAEKLREKCGQEEISTEEELEELQDETADVTPGEDVEETASAKAEDPDAILSQQQYLPESEVLSKEMLVLILNEIYERRGLEWTDKRRLFIIIQSLKLSFPDNILIGRLLKLGYLEKNPDNPFRSSRLSSLAKFLLEEKKIEKMTAGMEIVTYDHEELKVLQNFKEIRQLAEEHAILQESLTYNSQQLDALTVKKERLRERIEKFNLLARAKMEEMTLQITEVEESIKQTKEKITPRMVGATRKYEILVSELPSE